MFPEPSAWNSTVRLLIHPPSLIRRLPPGDRLFTSLSSSVNSTVPSYLTSSFCLPSDHEKLPRLCPMRSNQPERRRRRWRWWRWRRRRRRRCRLRRRCWWCRRRRRRWRRRWCRRRRWHRGVGGVGGVGGAGAATNHAAVGGVGWASAVWVGVGGSVYGHTNCSSTSATNPTTASATDASATTGATDCAVALGCARATTGVT